MQQRLGDGRASAARHHRALIYRHRLIITYSGHLSMDLSAKPAPSGPHQAPSAAELPPLTWQRWCMRSRCTRTRLRQGRVGLRVRMVRTAASRGRDGARGPEGKRARSQGEGPGGRGLKWCSALGRARSAGMHLWLASFIVRLGIYN